MPKPRAPKFKVGQVVSVRKFYGGFARGETGPGFRGKRGWRHGFVFGKIVEIAPRSPSQKPSSPHCYFLDGWMSAQSENDLRAQTKREDGRG